MSEEDQKLLYGMRKQFGLLSQEESDKDMFDELMQKFRDGTITAEELQRLMGLLNQFGITLSDEEQKKIRDFRKQFGMLS